MISSACAKTTAAPKCQQEKKQTNMKHNIGNEMYGRADSKLKSGEKFEKKTKIRSFRQTS
jgi:hypothetical protein